MQSVSRCSNFHAWYELWSDGIYLVRVECVLGINFLLCMLDGVLRRNSLEIKGYWRTIFDILTVAALIRGMCGRGGIKFEILVTGSQFYL